MKNRYYVNLDYEAFYIDDQSKRVIVHYVYDTIEQKRVFQTTAIPYPERSIKEMTLRVGQFEECLDWIEGND